MSAINLTTQNIEQETNIVRIAARDSLDLVNSLKLNSFYKSGIEISPYTETIQDTLGEMSGQKVKAEGALSPEGKGGEFFLKPVDVVIMNPPFSDREKMPFGMRERLKKNPLGSICGHQVNLWGYFLVLSDLLLSAHGKMGAVIPINIARGGATAQIREHLLENYTIKYIVKPIGDVAFSEGAAFKDILLIAEKKKPTMTDNCTVVFLKKSIKSDNYDEVTKLMPIITRKEMYSDDSIETKIVPYNNLLEFKDNLMPILSRNYDIIAPWIYLNNKTNKLTKIKESMFTEGFHASPKGLSQLVFVTNPVSKERTERAFLILRQIDRQDIIAQIKGLPTKSFAINKSNTYPSLRTITGVRTLAIKELDYIIVSKYADYDFVLNLSKWDKTKPIDWSKIQKEAQKKSAYLLIAERFRPDSDNTHLLAFVSNERATPPHTIRICPSFTLEEAKIQALFLNSVVFISQILLNKEETTGGYLHLMEFDLVLMNILDLDKLTTDEKHVLLNLFDRFQNVEFPSILEQFQNRFWERVELDKTILKILGLSNREISEWLPKVYNVMVEELLIMKKF
jgi:hypothetical protein